MPRTEHHLPPFNTDDDCQRHNKGQQGRLAAASRMAPVREPDQQGHHKQRHRRDNTENLHDLPCCGKVDQRQVLCLIALHLAPHDPELQPACQRDHHQQQERLGRGKTDMKALPGF